MLRVCTATVYKLVDRSMLVHVRMLNAIRFRSAEVACYLRDRSDPPKV